MIKKINSITLSLAGICQSAYLVQKLAQLGKCDEHAFNTCLKSILQINSISVISVYGNNEKNLHIGLKTLISILTFSNFSYSYYELIKYIFDMMIVENKLKKNDKSILFLKKRILNISSEYDVNMLISELSTIYLDVISNLGFRIEVKGNKIFLTNSQIQEKIRCLLFAGIRSIVLWRQCGGSRVKLIFFRYRIIKKAQKILNNIKNKT